MESPHPLISPSSYPSLPGNGGENDAAGPANMIDGTYAGSTLPNYLYKDGRFGELTVLRLEAVNGTLPRSPFLIKKSVEAFIGEVITDARPERRGETYMIKVRNNNVAQKLVRFTELSDKTKVRVVPHPTLNTSKCIISNVETMHMSEAELKEELAPQGVTDV